MLTRWGSRKNVFLYRVPLKFENKKNEWILHGRNYFGSFRKQFSTITTTLTKGKVNASTMYYCCNYSFFTLPRSFPGNYMHALSIKGLSNLSKDYEIKGIRKKNHTFLSIGSQVTASNFVINISDSKQLLQCYVHSSCDLHGDNKNRYLQKPSKLRGQQEVDHITFGELLSSRMNMKVLDEDLSICRNIPSYIFSASKYPTFAMLMEKRGIDPKISASVYNNMWRRAHENEDHTSTIEEKGKKIDKNYFKTSMSQESNQLIPYLDSNPVADIKSVTSQNMSTVEIPMIPFSSFKQYFASELHNISLNNDEKSVFVKKCTRKLYPLNRREIILLSGPISKYISLFKNYNSNCCDKLVDLKPKLFFITEDNKPGISEKPVSRDQLVDIPLNKSKSILGIINSIDRSEVIIQKDLYITNKIMEKIKDKKKNSEDVAKQSSPMSERENLTEFIDGTIELADNHIGSYLYSYNKEYTDTITNNISYSVFDKTKENDTFISSFKPEIDYEGSENKKISVAIFDKRKEKERNSSQSKNSVNENRNDKGESVSNNNVSQSNYPPTFVDNIVTNLRNPASLPTSSKTSNSQFRSSHYKTGSENDCTVDVSTETNIKLAKFGNKAKVQVHEVQTFKDKRLPLTFTTDTLMHIQGSAEKLKEITEIVEVAKTKLVLANSKTESGTKSDLDHSVKLTELLSFLRHKLLLGSGNSSKKIPIHIEPVPPEKINKSTINETIRKDPLHIFPSENRKKSGNSSTLNSSTGNLNERSKTKSKNLNKTYNNAPKSKQGNKENSVNVSKLSKTSKSHFSKGNQFGKFRKDKQKTGSAKKASKEEDEIKIVNLGSRELDKILGVKNKSSTHPKTEKKVNKRYEEHQLGTKPLLRDIDKIKEGKKNKSNSSFKRGKKIIEIKPVVKTIRESTRKGTSKKEMSDKLLHKVKKNDYAGLTSRDLEILKSLKENSEAKTNKLSTKTVSKEESNKIASTISKEMQKKTENVDTQDAKKRKNVNLKFTPLNETGTYEIIKIPGNRTSDKLQHASKNKNEIIIIPSTSKNIETVKVEQKVNAIDEDFDKKLLVKSRHIQSESIERKPIPLKNNKVKQSEGSKGDDHCTGNTKLKTSDNQPIIKEAFSGKNITLSKKHVQPGEENKNIKKVEKDIKKLKVEGDKIQNPIKKIKVEGDKVQDPIKKIKVEGGKVQDSIKKIKVQGGKTQNPIKKIEVEGDKVQDPIKKIKVEGDNAEDPFKKIKVEGDKTQVPIKKHSRSEQPKIKVPSGKEIEFVNKSDSRGRDNKVKGNLVKLNTFPKVKHSLNENRDNISSKEPQKDLKPKQKLELDMVAKKKKSVEKSSYGNEVIKKTSIDHASLSQILREERPSENLFPTPSIFQSPESSLNSQKPVPQQHPVEIDNVNVDIDKLSKETKHSLDVRSAKRCIVSLDKLVDFPLLNSAKPQYQFPSEGIICLDCKKDAVLRQNLKTYPSVTRVLNATMSDSSKIALSRWRTNMISQLGETGFQAFYKGQLQSGNDFHEKVKKHFGGEKQDLVNSPNAALRSLFHLSNYFSDVSVLESHVIHQKLAYRGVIDCVAKYKGKDVLIEWKRSDKKKTLLKHTFDAPLQLCAYMGALNYDTNYNFQIEGGLIVVAYSDGSPAEVFNVPLEECQSYWRQWLSRLKQYMLDAEGQP